MDAPTENHDVVGRETEIQITIKDEGGLGLKRSRERSTSSDEDSLFVSETKRGSNSHSSSSLRQRMMKDLEATALKAENEMGHKELKSPKASTSNETQQAKRVRITPDDSAMRDQNVPAHQDPPVPVSAEKALDQLLANVDTRGPHGNVDRVIQADASTTIKETHPAQHTGNPLRKERLVDLLVRSTFATEPKKVHGCPSPHRPPIPAGPNIRKAVPPQQVKQIVPMSASYRNASVTPSMKSEDEEARQGGGRERLETPNSTAAPGDAIAHAMQLLEEGQAKLVTKLAERHDQIEKMSGRIKELERMYNAERARRMEVQQQKDKVDDVADEGREFMKLYEKLEEAARQVVTLGASMANPNLGPLGKALADLKALVETPMDSE